MQFRYARESILENLQKSTSIPEINLPVNRDPKDRGMKIFCILLYNCGPLCLQIFATITWDLRGFLVD